MLLGGHAARRDVRAVLGGVLEAGLIGDEEECLLREHLLPSHPKTLQPGTLRTLLQHFVVTERPPPAA